MHPYLAYIAFAFDHQPLDNLLNIADDEKQIQWGVFLFFILIIYFMPIIIHSETVRASQEIRSSVSSSVIQFVFGHHILRCISAINSLKELPHDSNGKKQFLQLISFDNEHTKFTSFSLYNLSGHWTHKYPRCFQWI